MFINKYPKGHRLQTLTICINKLIPILFGIIRFNATNKAIRPNISTQNCEKKKKICFITRLRFKIYSSSFPALFFYLQRFPARSLFLLLCLSSPIFPVLNVSFPSVCFACFDRRARLNNNNFYMFSIKPTFRCIFVWWKVNRRTFASFFLLLSFEKNPRTRHQAQQHNTACLSHRYRNYEESISQNPFGNVKQFQISNHFHSPIILILFTSAHAFIFPSFFIGKWNEWRKRRKKYKKRIERKVFFPHYMDQRNRFSLQS